MQQKVFKYIKVEISINALINAQMYSNTSQLIILSVYSNLLLELWGRGPWIML